MYCAHDDWIYYPYVHLSSAAYVRRKNKVLLVQRAKEPYRGMWMMPAGFVEYGEHPQETVKRELKEETNLMAKTLKLLTVYQVSDDPRAMGAITFIYKVDTSGKIKNEKKENIAVAWFDIDNLPKVAWQSHRSLLRKMR